MENVFTQFHIAWKTRAKTRSEHEIYFHNNCTSGRDIRRKIGACGVLALSYICDYLPGEGPILRCSDHALIGWPGENSGEAAESHPVERRPTIRVNHLDREW